jgi:3D (Asp-Asp-Asp) domain-containing protein
MYYKPIIDKSKDKCEPADLRDMPDENGKVLISLCKRHYDNCLMQGSCFVTDGDRTRAIQFTNKVDGVSRWAEKHEDRCPYGYGVRAICLDPFYSVAADLTIHKPGDVIYVPKLVGLVLPDGTQHNGYLIVRDEGGRIVGENRFDFFTGFFGPFDPENAFFKIGLSDINHRFGYQKANEDLAKKVRAYRNYPNIP